MRPPRRRSHPRGESRKNDRKARTGWWRRKTSAAWLASPTGMPVHRLGLLGNGHIAGNAHAQTRARWQESRLSARQTGAPAPARRDNSEIRLRADKRSGEREEEAPAVGTRSSGNPGAAAAGNAGGRHPRSRARGRKARARDGEGVEGRKEQKTRAEKKKQPNLGWELSIWRTAAAEGVPERGERPRAPTGVRESRVCAALLVNKKERGGASHCSAGKLQPALLIGLTEP